MHSGFALKTVAVTALAATSMAVAGIGAAQAADATRPLPSLAPAYAHDLLFGVTVTSQYISRGLEQSSGPAVQPWAEFNLGPFYAGYWGSNTDPTLTPGSWEHDLSVGVRFEPGPLAIDIGYVRYVYDTGDCCGEVYGKVSITPVERLTLGAAIFHNPDGALTYLEGNGELALTDRLALSGAIGSQDGVGSGNVSHSFAVNDKITLDGRYHAGPTVSQFVASIAFSTSLSAFMSGRPLY
jgi:uncharacterized protein (TIGR02001 family)